MNGVWNQSHVIFSFFYNYFNWRLITVHYGFCHTAQYLSCPPEVLLASTHAAPAVRPCSGPDTARCCQTQCPGSQGWQPIGSCSWLLYPAQHSCAIYSLLNAAFLAAFLFSSSLSVFVFVQLLEEFFFFFPTQLLTLSLRFLFQSLVKKERLVLVILFLHQEEKLKWIKNEFFKILEVPRRKLANIFLSVF